jgi:hypothetical protein
MEVKGEAICIGLVPLRSLQIAPMTSSDLVRPGNLATWRPGSTFPGIISVL